MLTPATSMLRNVIFELAAFYSLNIAFKPLLVVGYLQ